MKNNSHTLTKGSVGKGILLFALPLLGSSLIQQLYSTVDLIFVGQLLGTKASAAIGASGLIVTCLIGFFNGMAVGTNVFAARHYGAKRFNELKKLIQTIFWTGIIGGLLLMVIGLIFSPIFLTWMGTPKSIFPLAVAVCPRRRHGWRALTNRGRAHRNGSPLAFRRGGLVFL